MRAWPGRQSGLFGVQGRHHRRMAKVFVGELVQRGICVNTVIPVTTRTPIWTRGARAR
ncbi:MAG: hypothetical protein CBARDMAM_5081 [uncultured Caballeronia sp.]|nr:MAG: hypothetical protein CBARDMAM_5081 [uncultured Caballeronia sp.]